MSENKEITIKDVINKRKEHSRRVDIKLIMRAYRLASEKHKGQKRSSGEPYIIHPLNVAYILADIGLDDSTICAALLHDVVEDTDVKDKDLRDEVYNINNVDFFIIIGTDGESKRTEVHIPGITPTALGSTSLFGQGDDDSSAGDYYLSKDNLCWGFVVPAEFKWPVERANIKDVYPGFAGWVKSGGTSDTGWYDDTPAGDVYEQ